MRRGRDYGVYLRPLAQGGTAQSLAAGGATLVEMQIAGRWTSPQMPGHYARGQLAAKGAVARVRHQHREAAAPAGSRPGRCPPGHHTE